MQLEDNLAAWETRSARMRRGLLIAAVTYASCLALLFIVSVGLRGMPANLPLAQLYQWIGAAAFLALWLSMIVGGGLLVLYFYRDAPALKRARFDAHSAMILELQHQVEQLRQELRKRDG